MPIPNWQEQNSVESKDAIKTPKGLHSFQLSSPRLPLPLRINDKLTNVQSSSRPSSPSVSSIHSTPKHFTNSIDEGSLPDEFHKILEPDHPTTPNHHIQSDQRYEEKLQRFGSSFNHLMGRYAQKMEELTLRLNNFEQVEKAQRNLISILESKLSTVTAQNYRLKASATDFQIQCQVCELS